MACVFKRKVKWVDKDGKIRSGKTKTYFARFDAGGKQYCIKTGKKSKGEAEKELKNLIAIHRGTAKVEDHFNGLLDLIGKLPDGERDSKRHYFARKLLAGQHDKLRLTDGWKYWKASPNKKRTPKDSTLTGYDAIWRRFQTWATTKGLEYFHEASEKHAHDYAKDLWESKVSPSTFNAHVKFLMGMFTLLESDAGLTENVWRKIIRKDKTPDQGRRNLTEEELRLVLSRATGNLRVMFAIGLFTGLRLGDTVNLRWADVDAKPGFIVVLPMKVSRLGNVKKVELPIHSALRRALDEYKQTESGDFLFPTERVLYSQNPGNVTSQIQEFFESCGIQTNEKSENGDRRRAIVRVGFHSLRHSFVSMCAKAGAPQHVVQQLVGHGSPAMTQHYTHLDDQQKQNAVTALPDFGNLLPAKN